MSTTTHPRGEATGDASATPPIFAGDRSAGPPTFAGDARDATRA
ncbi:MAG TPA: hypothetical protein VFH03_21080 [Actinoplanes sp.]|nr:hypothetical protein [Actinoplanes sp.]